MIQFTHSRVSAFAELPFTHKRIRPSQSVHHSFLLSPPLNHPFVHTRTAFRHIPGEGRCRGKVNPQRHLGVQSPPYPSHTPALPWHRPSTQHRYFSYRNRTSSPSTARGQKDRESARQERREERMTKAHANTDPHIGMFSSSL